MTGKLYLIPTGLGDGAPLEIIPISIKKIIESIDVYIVENEKSARKFIKTISSGKSQSSLTLFSLNKFTDPMEIPSFLEECYEGNNIGLLSDAGCPGIADPGAEVVKIAHKKNIKIIPLVGPSSILLAMMSSGMNGQNFAFNGYLPIEKAERKSKIKQLEKRSFVENQSQLFIETPYRVVGKDGKFEKIPTINFLERLHKRNSFFIDSHHPLRETLILQTGKTNTNRMGFFRS